MNFESKAFINPTVLNYPFKGIFYWYPQLSDRGSHVSLMYEICDLMVRGGKTKLRSYFLDIKELP